MRRVLRSTVVVAGACGALLVVAMAILAPALAPQPPDDQNFELIEAPSSAPTASGETS